MRMDFSIYIQYTHVTSVTSVCVHVCVHVCVYVCVCDCVYLQEEGDNQYYIQYTHVTSVRVCVYMCVCVHVCVYVCVCTFRKRVITSHREEEEDHILEVPGRGQYPVTEAHHLHGLPHTSLLLQHQLL